MIKKDYVTVNKRLLELRQKWDVNRNKIKDDCYKEVINDKTANVEIKIVYEKNKDEIEEIVDVDY